MATRVYWYRVATHRNVETENSVCLSVTRSRKEARTAINNGRFIKRWRDRGWVISLGRRLVESTGDVWWEVWAHCTPQLSIKPVATIYRVQTIE